MTREALAKLLAEIGPPGENREEKVKAVEELGLKNRQGFNVSTILESFEEY